MQAIRHLKTWQSTSLTLKDIIRQAPDLAEAYALLGQCYDRLGNLDEAISQFGNCGETGSIQCLGHDVLPRICFNAARGLRQIHGPYWSAIPAASLTVDQRREMATLFAQGGDTRQAAQVLGSSEGGDMRIDLMLAELYRQQNQTADVEKLCVKMMKRIRMRPQLVLWQISMRLKEKCHRLVKRLSMLDQLKLPHWVSSTSFRADFASRHESINEAVTYLKTGLAALRDKYIRCGASLSQPATGYWPGGRSRVLR